MITGKEEKLRELYGVYNETIKPLIAKIEARLQKFPLEILNEIRAFNDHIARCYLPLEAKIDHEIELQKAESHIVRITLDCYKLLNVIYFDGLEKFMTQDGKIADYRDIENGEFFKEIQIRREEAEKFSEEARKQESIDKNKSLEYWQKMFVAYSLLFEYIDDNQKNIIWARGKFKREHKKDRRRQYVLLIVSIVLSWLLGHFSSPYIKNIFNKGVSNEEARTEQVEMIDNQILSDNN